MKKIIIEVGIFFIQATLVCDGKITELYVEDRSAQSMVGNIYKGKVTNVLPGMQSIFVDVGNKKDVFVYVGDFQKVPDFLVEEYGIESPQQAPLVDIKKLFRIGNQIIIQIMKDPIGTKGARGTPHLTLPGHYLVLMPQDCHVGISRRVEDEKERNKLKNTIVNCNKENYGLIVRTAASYKTPEELEREYSYLIHLWQKICRKMEKKGLPNLIHREPELPLRVIRDFYDRSIDEIIINHEGFHKEIEEFISFIDPSGGVKLSLYDEAKAGKPLFEEYGLETELSNSLQRRIDLKNGSYLVLEHTEALTAVDVNTGSFVGKTNLEETVFAVNKEAALEISRQIRLRDIGGIIIIDFIDMKEHHHQDEILRILNEGFQNDKSRVCIKGITDFGLVEMTRKKVKNSLLDTLTEPCHFCSGSGRAPASKKIADKIYSFLKSKKHGLDQDKLIVHPVIYDFIQKNKLLKDFDSATGHQLTLDKDPGLRIDEFEAI
ncbi:MAG: Rne/Rng family ribonuclease [Candidatus Wallbacteria bacterium]|nr:Rne/Rng family ribonuclease [Candidatus Wallbacteria bacterium]